MERRVGDGIGEVYIIIVNTFAVERVQDIEQVRRTRIQIAVGVEDAIIPRNVEIDTYIELLSDFIGDIVSLAGFFEVFVFTGTTAQFYAKSLIDQRNASEPRSRPRPR